MKSHRHDNLDRRLRMLEKAFETIQIGVTITDTESRIIYVNPADARMHGYDGRRAPRPGRRRLRPERKLRQKLDRLSCLKELAELEPGERQPAPGRQSASRYTSPPTWCLDATGAPVGLISSCQDISAAQGRPKSALTESEARYALGGPRRQRRHLGLGPASREEIYFSPRWKAMLGYEEDEIGEHGPRPGSAASIPEDRWAFAPPARQAHLRGPDGRTSRSSTGCSTPTASYRWMRTRGVALHDDADDRAVRIAGSQADITGLKVKRPPDQPPQPGAAASTIWPSPWAAPSGGGRSAFAVLFLDLDRFKVVNDSLGHLFGDQLLASVAQPPREVAMRPGDTVARYGGDEFCVLVEDINDQADSIRVAERVLEDFSEPFDLAGSRGLHQRQHRDRGQLIPNTARLPEELLRDADLAMYRAKALGGSRYQLFDERDPPPGHRSSWSSRPISAGRSTGPSSGSTTRASSSSRPNGWSASRPWCAGSTRSGACSRPGSSCRWPRRPG